MILLARGVFLKKNGERYYPAPYMPIGSIYLTVSNDNPSKWFGGTWEKMPGGYLYACVNSIGNSSYTGIGTRPHTLTISEMPSHTHIQNSHKHNIPYRNDGGPYDISIYFSYNSGNVKTWWNGSICTDTTTATNQNTGGGQAHSHDIAYKGVWCWKRIA